MTITTVCGRSDDIISVEGAVSEEFQYVGPDNGDLLAFSNGVVLRVRWTGVWRITPVTCADKVRIVAAPEDDEDLYSDVATLDGVKWVMHGRQFASSTGSR